MNPAANAFLFYLMAGLAAASAIGVVASKNIVRTAVMLLGALLAVAGLYFLLQAEFLAAVQLVVYAGGTLVLIVFGVMLTSRGLASDWKIKKAEVAGAILIGMALLAGLVKAFHDFKFQISDQNESHTMGQLGVGLMGDYLVPFEMSSVVLLVVMIGAAYLAKGKKR